MRRLIYHALCIAGMVAFGELLHWAIFDFKGGSFSDGLFIGVFSMVVLINIAEKIDGKKYLPYN